MPAYALPEIKPTFPRLANYFLHWTISDDEAASLAKFDLVILDAEVQYRSRAQMEMIRRLNPQVILLAYIPAAEVRRDALSLQEIAPLRAKLAAQIPEPWYLKDALGNRQSFWPGTWIVNVTGPWQAYLPEFVAREILTDPLWDGVFYDNAWDDIVHFARGVPDVNQDGIQDAAEEARKKWQDGLRVIYRETIARTPDKFVFENDGPMYAPEVHGVLLENFPRKGWARHREELTRVRNTTKPPGVTILNATTQNTGARDDFARMRWGLTTALLHDAFYSFDFGDADHGQTWQYDEYGVFLGEAVGPARPPLNPPLDKGGKGGVWRRDFEKGLVVVNTTEKLQQVSFPIDVEKIRGTQDPTANSGEIVRELVVAPQDGLIVLRPLQTIVGAPFENGVFARIFNAQGEVRRAGFFALDRRERSGVVITLADMDGDGEIERIKREAGGESIAIGDLTGEGVKEIVIGKEGKVWVQRVDGTVVTPPFFPFGPRYKAAVSVAVGDLNGDGFSEIVVGAGAGGGPQVRIFSGQGRLLSGGFFAYDPRFRGGVRVSVGDVTGDGRAEIVTGPGVGGGPQIRVFDGKGRAIGAGFFAFDRASRAGAIPIVTDVDGDGQNEILAVTKEVL